MNPFDAVRRCLTSGYATFSGRARRSEFWWFFLFALIVNLIATLVDAQLGLAPVGGGAAWTVFAAAGPISAIAALAFVLPNFAVGARRLHDGGRSGWWQLLLLAPLVGLLVLIWFWTRPTEPEPNRFGPSPVPSS